jgi:hypothetical protein
MDENKEESYSTWSIVGSLQVVFWAIFFLLCIAGAIIALLQAAPIEDQISPYPAPSSNSTVEEWNEPNFDNLDQDGFIGGQR